MFNTKNKKSIILGLALLMMAGALFLFSHEVKAAFEYQPMEKIPGFETETGSKTPNLIVWIESIYKFGIWVVGICALFMITIGGFTYMTSAGNTSTAGTGKKIITDAIIGLILALVAVLLFTVINPNITTVNLQITPANTTPTPGAGTPPGGPVGGGTSPSGEKICPQAGVNFCEPSSCSVRDCSKYDSFINKAAEGISISGVNTKALIKAIINEESHCNFRARSPKGACGIMQILPETANNFKAQCGVTENIDCAWLQAEANVEKTICISAKYAASLVSSCGPQIVNIAAGYNGGAGACGNSADCTADSCGGGRMKKWECLFDNPEHTICNADRPQGSYFETRNYAPKVLACYNNFNK